MVCRVILVGLMGSGKTTIGRALARRLNWQFFDSDHEIEARTGVSIPTIFEIEGEEGFRRRESSVIEELCACTQAVIATGGGAVLKKENRDVLCKAGLVAYLDVSPAILYERTRGDRNRPLLQVEDPLLRLQHLYAERDPLYREVADRVYDGTRYGASALVGQIAASMQKASCKN